MPLFSFRKSGNSDDRGTQEMGNEVLAFSEKCRLWAMFGCFALVLPRFCTADSPPLAVSKTEFLANGSLAGTARDLSGFGGRLEEGTPMDRIGGFSAIEFSGSKNQYWVLADRGPADGATSYHCRIHEIQLEIDAQSGAIQPRLIATVPLFSKEREPLVGSHPLLKSDSPERGLALDPEGLRLLPGGGFAISEEYGPAIDEFSIDGLRQRSWQLPPWMLLTRELDLKKAKQGAMPNRGLEGLAISADGKRLISAMQGPLIQDSFQKGEKRFSNFTRIIDLPLDGRGDPKQWLYPLTDRSNGISEILTVDENRFLVLERDGKTRTDAKCKGVYLIDTSHATNVGASDHLDPIRLANGVQAVEKRLAIDLLDPALRIPERFSLEKPEGLAWGPDLADGRKTLIVCFDNDFVADQESLFLAFAFARE